MIDHQLPKRFGFSNTGGKKNILSGNRQNKFEQTVKSMSKITTFVDLTKRLKELNPLQSRQIQIIIHHLKQQSKLKKYFKNQDDQNIIAISKQLELEIDMLNHIDDDEKQNIIVDILQFNFQPKQIAAMIQESSITLETQHTLHQIEEKIQKKSIQKQSKNHLLEQVDKINFLSDINSDSQDFYRGTIKGCNTKRHQLETDSLSVNEKFELLKKYLLEKGIQIEKQEKVPHQQYSKYYAEQANKLIKSTRLKQLKQIQISPLKSAHISPDILAPQMYHTNSCQKKLDRLASHYQTSNNLSSTTLHSPLPTPSRLLQQKSFEQLNQPLQPMTERIEAKRISDHAVSPPQKSMLLTLVEPPQPTQSQIIQHSVSEYSKSIDQLREFQAKSKAVQTFFRMENKDYLHTMRDMEKVLKKPLKQHFNEFMKVHQDENDGTDMVAKRKNNVKRNIRLNKIFKSELE